MAKPDLIDRLEMVGTLAEHGYKPKTIKNIIDFYTR